ncbi:glycoside hydrolase family 19 protein [Gilliamella sp. Choc3-5]|uniref:glycoside hydrolase family 19 protein n=1 Tax=Gilliamella sp. Choc3-5 TaxID=3120236 RepID=UPI0011475F0E|nr:glycoside hydrolase family 19 protein [Gilliamella apicola]
MTQGQIEIHEKVQKLEQRVMDWEKSKEKIKKMLWWDDVAKGLAKLNQTNGTQPENTNTTDTKVTPIDSASPATLSADGKAWFIHPVQIISIVNKKYQITTDFLEKVMNKTEKWFNGKGGGKTFEENFILNYPDIYQIDKTLFVSLLNSSLKKFNITTPYQKAHFLAQCFHESAGFESTLEFSSGINYEPDVHKDAIKNGNTKKGDGPKYKGRGLIQLTWKNNYIKFSKYEGVDFVANPDLIAQNMKYSIDVSCWFWRFNGDIYKKYNANGDINILIDNEKDNVTLVTKAVNGGRNGLEHRIRIFNKIKEEWELE